MFDTFVEYPCHLFSAGRNAWLAHFSPSLSASVVVQKSPQSEIAEENMQPDSYVGGDIFRLMYPLRTFVAFHKLRKKIQMEKGDSLSKVLI